MDEKSRKKPSTQVGDLAHLPSALAPLIEQKQFCVWTYERQKRDGDTFKWIKRPQQPDTLVHASINDLRTWGKYEQAVRRWRDGDADGIGFMLLRSGIGSV